MSSNVNYPYFPISPPPHANPPPPPPPHIIPPPPHASPPPPSPHVLPPPPPPYVLPPPPFNPITPPPPHVLPPPSPDHGPTVIVVIFISLGCIFFLAFCFLALWCLIKKKKKRATQEVDIVRVDEHLKVKEAIVEGPHGSKVVVLSIEEDKHIEEEIFKNEKFGNTHLHAKSGEIATIPDFEAGESSFNPNVHHTHHHLEYKP